MRVAPKIELSPEEKTILSKWSRGRSTPARLVLRAKVVLLAAEGVQSREIALRLKTSRQTVGLWRSRFAARRCAGIEKDAPRGGRHPRKREKVEHLPGPRSPSAVWSSSMPVMTRPEVQSI